MKYINKADWYGSDEHFQTEMSWDEYQEEQQFEHMGDSSILSPAEMKRVSEGVLLG